MKNFNRIYIHFFTFDIEHPEYGKDTTTRFYYNCEYNEAYEFAVKDLESSGWKILDYDHRNIVAWNLQMLKD